MIFSATAASSESGRHRAAITLLDFPTARLPAVLVHHADVGPHHSLAGDLVHVTDGETTHAGVRIINESAWEVLVCRS